MSNSKPEVFVTQQQILNKEQEAALQMQLNTEKQIAERNRLLDEAQRKADETDANRAIVEQQYQNRSRQNISPTPTPYSGLYSEKPISTQQTMLEQLNQPQMHLPHDIIPLPSEGKLYPNKKSNVKVAYMTTADEDILTSPNLLESGDFLEILINRKLLEPELRYKDLHMGDRDAIMLWLRATSYGHMYPITVIGDDNIPFDTDFDLNSLKVKNLGAEPDSNGHFSFKLPQSGNNIKFKFLNVGEKEYLNEFFEKHKDDLVKNESTIMLLNQIIEVDGNRDREFVKEFIQTMRILDAKSLRKYMGEIESGIDMNITIGTPGGGSINTFLPLTTKFFWPDL